MSATIKLSAPATHEFWEINVLYEDEHLLALDKPPGLLVSPDRLQPDRPTLVKLLHEGIALGKPWARERSLTYLKPTQRLDGEASGILLLAKNKAALVKVVDLFGTEIPGRKYLALVRGEPPEETLEIESRLAPSPMNPQIMRVDPRNGKRSRTTVSTQEKFADYTLVRCEALTDRPHQIRLHLRSASLPVVGDALYGGKPLWLSRLKPAYRLKPDKTERPLIDRPAVHAGELNLPHPVSGEPLTITAPLPKDLAVGMKYLRKYAK